jgi:hypothetical protein
VKVGERPLEQAFDKDITNFDKETSVRRTARCIDSCIIPSGMRSSFTVHAVVFSWARVLQDRPGTEIYSANLLNIVSSLS